MSTSCFPSRDGEDEIDLIYDHPDQPVAFEIASSPSHRRGGIAAFMNRFPRYRGRCCLVAPGAVPARPEADGIGSIPLDLLQLAIGAQTEKAFHWPTGPRKSTHFSEANAIRSSRRTLTPFETCYNRRLQQTTPASALVIRFLSKRCRGRGRRRGRIAAGVNGNQLEVIGRRRR